MPDAAAKGVPDRWVGVPPPHVIIDRVGREDVARRSFGPMWGELVDYPKTVDEAIEKKKAALEQLRAQAGAGAGAATMGGSGGLGLSGSGGKGSGRTRDATTYDKFGATILAPNPEKGYREAYKGQK